ncbi:MAG: cation diffusion facilitator family transporter [Phycisphaerae bacterium]|nr:cation diffusion facilitator family transporter [Phycisphaerae bacterium]
MNDEKNRTASRLIKSLTWWSLVTNTLLFLLKIVAGWVFGSMAMVADALHSLSDSATDLVVFVGHHLGSKGPDKEHPYGHGRIETFSSGIIALVLVAVGVGMIIHAGQDIAAGHVSEPRVVVLIVALVSVVVKELLYQATVRAAKLSHSSALYANAWHHRSDAFSSVAVLLGVAGMYFQFKFGDQVAAIVVGLMIVTVGFKVLGDCLSELAESAVDHETLELIEGIIKSQTQIHDYHKLRTRSVGREIFLDLHILVDQHLNLKDAHDIAESLEKTIEDSLTCPVNITIHVEPDLPELRFS